MKNPDGLSGLDLLVEEARGRFPDVDVVLDEWQARAASMSPDGLADRMAVFNLMIEAGGAANRGASIFVCGSLRGELQDSMKEIGLSTPRNAA